MKERAIIEKCRKTIRTDKKVDPDWKSMYEHERSAHNSTEEALRVATKIMTDLHIQTQYPLASEVGEPNPVSYWMKLRSKTQQPKHRKNDREKA